MSCTAHVGIMWNISSLKVFTYGENINLDVSERIITYGGLFWGQIRLYKTPTDYILMSLPTGMLHLRSTW